MSAPVYEQEEEEKGFIEIWTGKAKRNPFMAAGILGFIGVGIQGIRKYKHHRAAGMSPSLFLVQLRVIGQGTVVGALCIALGIQAFNEMMNPPAQKNDKN